MTDLLNRLGIPAIFAVLTLAVGCAGSEGKAKSPADAKGESSDKAEVGKQAPDLSIQGISQKGKISLDSLQGKVVIIDFWATWCGPCKESFPKLDALSKRIGDKAMILGVSVDDDRPGIAEFAKENGATFTIGWDEGHVVAQRWKVDKMPTTVIVDGAGKIRYIHEGYHDGETDKMGKEVASIIEEGPASSSGDTRVAKNDTPSTKESGSSKEDSKSGDEKPGKAEAASTADDTSDEAPPPKKKPKAKAKGKGKTKKKKASSSAAAT